MRIEKTYEQNVNLGNYEMAKIGVKITSDKEIKPEEFADFSNKLGIIAKKAVQKELEILKQEHNSKQ